MAYGGSAFIGEGVKASLEQVAKNVEGGVIPDCGHWVTAEQPQFVIDKLREFLSRDPAQPVLAALTRFARGGAQCSRNGALHRSEPSAVLEPTRYNTAAQSRYRFPWRMGS